MHADPAIVQHACDIRSLIEPGAPQSAGEAFAERGFRWVLEARA